jgi:type VI secretion system protein ImpL
MDAVRRILLSRWFISWFGTCLLAGLVWTFAPLLPALEEWPVRLVIVLAMFLAWGGANVLLDALARGRDRALAAGLTAGGAEPGRDSGAGEVAALRERMVSALALLKKSRGKRGFLYQLPWYAIIGPPGAGKTTALLNAGLRFPLADAMGKGAMAGVGGTRLCDWWFTDEAVLIDTAGRYTTQDSDATVDRAGWDGFLGLLKSTRPRQPLNGVMVAIGLPDVAQASSAERLGHARTIRRRIDELQARLGVRMPLYVLFTKADLIAGFTEFFDDLDAPGRAQVWGTTFPLDAAGSPADAAFADAFGALVERLGEHSVQRLQAERNADRRAAIALFPNQVASLGQPLGEFLQAAFGGGGAGGDAAPLLRGVYFTSGTQEGTPVDRLIGSLARSFGLDQRRAASLHPEQGRSYFLERLLRDVVFNEAMLVAEPPALVRRRRAMHIGAAGVAAAIVLVVAGLLWHIRQSGEHQIDAVAAGLRGYEQTAKTLPLNPVADDDLPRVVPLLDEARMLPFGAASPPPPPPVWWQLGLSQDAKLGAASRIVYRHALERVLLPRLLWRLEAQMRGNLARPDFLYEATRVYLMLGSAGPLDRDLVDEWTKLDWATAYPGPEAAPLREALLVHLDALLAEPLPPVLLDGGLVAQARETFKAVTPAGRVYSRIKPSLAAQRLPPWRPSDALGAAGPGLFVRASGKPLADGVPGFFTNDGFHQVLLPSLADATHAVASESWVLGRRAEIDPNGPQALALQRDVIRLYEDDYEHVWDAMLADLNIAPMKSLPHAARDLYIIASPQSPVRALLVSIAQQLRLSVPLVAAQPEPRQQEAAAASGADATAMRLRSVVGAGRPGDAASALPGHEVDEHYKALLDLAGNGPGAPIDQVLGSLIDLQQQLAKLAAAPLGSTPPALPAGSDPTIALQSEAATLPPPVSRWILSIAASGAALRSGDPRQQLVVQFNAPGGPAAQCQAMADRYPFVRGSTVDAPVDDFARLFAPGGALDGFFNTWLRPYVDTTGRVWRPQTADGQPAPLGAADVAQFQRAAMIRALFFADGGASPSLRLDVMPASVDRVTRTATLSVDGTDIVASHEPPRAVQIAWPAPPPSSGSSLTFDPPPVGRAGVIQEIGPWSLFRLLGRAKALPSASPERTMFVFQLGDRQAGFDLRGGTPADPFSLSLLQEFRCPAVK